ncbi:cyclin-D4-1-like [Andrographis paniculata]|uniref:cyclin-D4-1-like n=1 Tax=Andrographis paniculata TaxID=175694 RepID=UPI0021E92B4D|nr:cyclin-D4-1-like [Andrographis paniculata]
MVEREVAHLPRDDYLMRLKGGMLDKSLRTIAFNWMVKACAACDFGELCFYLALSNFDRFLSMSEVSVHSPNLVDGEWTIPLVSVACLSLAAKMEEVDVPSPIHLQAGEPVFLFEVKTIQKMELMVSSKLNWRLKAYTPYSFLDYFLRKMYGEDFIMGPSISQSSQIISCMIEGIDFLEFKPSEIAAAVALYVLNESRAMDIDKTLSIFSQLDKARVVKCLELVQGVVAATATTDTSTNAGVDDSVSGSLVDSPIGVLEASECLSYSCDESDEDETAAELCVSHDPPQYSGPEAKRKKLYQTATAEGEAGDEKTMESSM